MDKLKLLLDINPNYIIVSLLVFFYTMEQILNTPFKYNKRPMHLFQNILFQMVFLMLNYFFAMFQTMSIIWFNDHNIGLLNMVQISYWLKLVLSVALFDLTTYWFHRMAHKVPLLWRLHRVHHSDTSMDSSTFFRAHPLEILVFGNSNIVAAAIFGLDLPGLGLYLLILIPIIFLQHFNFAFPIWIDRSIGYIFTTPNMHKVHHEQNQHYTDSNFSDIFIIWDRLFGTYKYRKVKEIKYGLKEFDEEKKQNFLYQMKSPFINIKRVTPEELKINE